MKTNESFWLSSKEAIDRIKMEGSDLLRLSEYGNLTFDIYKPRDKDKQQQHDKDEIYMVISGKGILVANDKRTNCRQGDILFVPAGVQHHYEDYSKDFCTWAVFSNPSREPQNVM